MRSRVTRNKRVITMRNETLSEAFALDLMREGRLLMKMHTVQGLRWFVVPGGKVTDNVAERILARPDVQPSDPGLFPGCSQTFRLSGDWRLPARPPTSRMSAKTDRIRGQFNRPPHRKEAPMGNRATYSYGNSKYMRADEWVGKQQRVHINAVDDVEFEQGLKPVLSFADQDKKLVVNATNFDVLMDAFGNNTNKWANHDVILEGTKVRFKGRTVDSIRIRVPTQAAKSPQDEAPDFDDEVPFAEA
jgi:hypothetical protein